MRLQEIKAPLIVILGPTAVGKTALSLQLAERLNGEIISADSRLFYRGMDIGTAKPSFGEQQIVPHHLIDVAEPDEIWSLALFQQAAFEKISQIHQRDRIPFLVGGTGQYIRAVVEGWEVPAQEPDRSLRKVLENWAEEIGPYALHEKLAVVDPVAAQVIDPPNVRRTVRALEVLFLTGQRFSDQRKRNQTAYDLLMIGLYRDRKTLYERVDARIESMLREGLLREVETLLAKGYDPNLPTFSAIGYAEIIQHLQGNLTLEEAVTLIKRKTRIFVRRQANWFKPDDPRIHWFDAATVQVGEIVDFIQSGNGWLLRDRKDLEA